MFAAPMPNSIGRIRKDGLQIRCLELTDVEGVLSIQSACREIAQWTNEDYACIARGPTAGDNAGWIAATAPDVIGFLVARRVVSDLEILNLAVSPALRREGTGTALLLEAVKWGVSFNAENVLLEVRESNLLALRFYEFHNFHVAGRRPRYYTAPVEDALLLTAPLRADHGTDSL